MASDSNRRILLVALAVCAVCSVLVSLAAVGLKPLQVENQRMDKLRNILAAGGLLGPGVDAGDTYNNRIRAVFIDLASGTLMDPAKIPAGVTPVTFNFLRLAADETTGMTIPGAEDLARMKRRPKFMPVYMVIDESQKVTKVILPVAGKGLWSTMFGFLALDADLRTIRGFTFYEHGETPGLGGEIDNPRWQKKWHGKFAFDEDGALAIEVLRGSVEPGDPREGYRVDGISGATKTTQGVQDLVRFWLGKNGYGPFLETSAQEGLHAAR